MADAKPHSLQRLRHQGEKQSPLFSFLDAELRRDFPFSIREEYPSVFGEFPGGESVFVVENGAIASHVAYVVREFLHPKVHLRLGLIGSVVTREVFRGRGFAQSLLREATSALRKQGCVVALLWSDKTSFYEAFEFYRGGREQAYGFSAEDIPESSVRGEPVPFNADRHVNWLWRLYSKHESRLDRSLEEQKLLCRIPNTEIYVTEKDSAVTSYLVLHKGADFENHVHEWGGDSEEVLKSLVWLQKRKYAGKPLTLIGPEHYDLRGFQRYARSRSLGALGLLKVLDPGRLRTIFLRYLHDAGVDYSWDAAAGRLKIQGQEVSVRNEKDLIAACFGDERRDGLPKLPFFLWGLDSI